MGEQLTIAPKSIESRVPSDEIVAARKGGRAGRLAAAAERHFQGLWEGRGDRAISRLVAETTFLRFDAAGGATRTVDALFARARRRGDPHEHESRIDMD